MQLTKIFALPSTSEFLSKEILNLAHVCVQWLRVHAASLQSGHLQIGLEVFRLEVGELRRHATAAARLPHGHSNWGLHVCLRWTIRFNIFKLDKGLLVEHLQTEQSYD